MVLSITRYCCVLLVVYNIYRKGDFATQTRWSATNTLVESGSLQFVAPQTRLWKMVLFRRATVCGATNTLVWKDPYAENGGRTCSWNVVTIILSRYTLSRPRRKQSYIPIHFRRSLFPSLFIGKWVCKTVRTDGSIRTIGKVGDGKAAFAFTMRDTHSSDPPEITSTSHCVTFCCRWSLNPYPTAFPYGNGMVLHFYQQQESSTTKTVHKVINKGLKTYV